jgi:hypothetical protein
MDGVQIASIEVSQEKARTAVRFKRSTTLISEAINQGRVDMLSMPGCLAVAGDSPFLLLSLSLFLSPSFWSFLYNISSLYFFV